MTVVLPSKLRAIYRLNEPLFSPTDASSRLKAWQELTALGVLAVEFPTDSTRVWLRDAARRDYDRAANPAKVAAWMAAQGVPVYGPDCPANLRSQVVHTDGDQEFTMAASEAMKTGAKLWIRYDGRIRGEVTERVVTPLSWSELGLVARCHLRNEDRTFVVARILQWKPA